MPDETVRIVVEGQDRLSPAARSASNSLSGLQQSAQRAQGALGSIARQAAGFGLAMVGVQAAGGIFGMLKEAVVGFNASMEQSKVAWSTMLGSTAAADAMLKDLQQFAATTPFEFPDLERSSKRLLAMGFAAKDIIPLMTDIGNATSALGMSAEGVDRITLAIGQMRAKSKVSGEEMRQLAEAGIPAWQMLATQIGKTVPETMKLSENGEIAADTFIKAFQTFSQQNWGGMMDKQSKTFLGSLSTITDNLRLAASSAFKPLFDRISDLALAISKFVQSNQFAEWAQRISTVVSSLLIRLEGLPDSVKGVAIAFGIAITAGAALAVVLGVAGAALGMILSPIGAVVAAAGLLAVAWQTNFLGIRDIAAKVLPAIANFVYEKIGGLLDWWNENLPNLQKTLQRVLGWIEGFWKGHGETILRIVGRIWEFIERAVGRAMDTLGDVISVAMNLIQGNWGDAWNAVMRIVGRALEAIIDALGTGAKIVVDIVGSVAKAFGKEDLTAGWADAIDRVMAMGKGLTASMGSVAPVLGKTNALMEENFAATKRGADVVRDYAAGLFDNLIPGLNNTMDDGLALAMAMDKGRTAMLGAGQAAVNLEGGLDKTKGAMTRMLDVAREKASDLKDALSAAKDKMQDLARTPLLGEGQLDERKFKLQQQMNALQLKITNLKLRFSPRNVPESLLKPLQLQLDKLGLTAEKVDLEGKLKFDPLRRKIDEYAKSLDGLKEKTYGAIIRGMKEQREQIDLLSPALAIAEGAVKTLERAYKALELAAKDATAAIKGTAAPAPTFALPPAPAPPTSMPGVAPKVPAPVFTPSIALPPVPFVDPTHYNALKDAIGGVVAAQSTLNKGVQDAAEYAAADAAAIDALNSKQADSVISTTGLNLAMRNLGTAFHSAQDSLGPYASGLGDLFGAIGGKFAEAGIGFWQNVIQPMGEKMADAAPIALDLTWKLSGQQRLWEDLGHLWLNTIRPALEWLNTFIGTVISKTMDNWRTNTIDKLIASFDGMAGALTASRNHLEDWANAIRNVKLPGLLAPAPPALLVVPTPPVRQARKGFQAFAQGGAFTVGGSGGIDSQLVQFLATPGEPVTVGKQAQGGVTLNYAPTVNVSGGTDIRSTIWSILEEHAQLMRAQFRTAVTQGARS